MAETQTSSILSQIMCSWIGVHQQSAMWSCKELLPDRKCWRLLQVSDLSAYTTATGTAAPSSTASAGGRPASTVGARKAAKRGRQKVPVAPLPANGKPAVAHFCTSRSSILQVAWRTSGLCQRRHWLPWRFQECDGNCGLGVCELRHTEMSRRTRRHAERATHLRVHVQQICCRAESFSRRTSRCAILLLVSYHVAGPPSFTLQIP